MEYKVIPLIIQQTNWLEYIKLYQDLFDESPTRVLDENNVKLDRPAALLQSIDNHFRGNTEKHASISFAGTANADMLIEIANCCDLSVISKESSKDRGLYIFIMSADLSTWRTAIHYLCLKERSNYVKILGEQLDSLIKMAGYRIDYSR